MITKHLGGLGTCYPGNFYIWAFKSLEIHLILLTSRYLPINTDEYHWGFSCNHAQCINKMIHPLCVDQNYITHPFSRAQKLMTHPLSATAQPPPPPPPSYLLASTLMFFLFCYKFLRSTFLDDKKVIPSATCHANLINCCEVRLVSGFLSGLLKYVSLSPRLFLK